MGKIKTVLASAALAAGTVTGMGPDLGPGSAEARSPDRQIVLLHCAEAGQVETGQGKAGSAQSAALCRALVQALAEAAGAAGASPVIRQVGAGATVPRRAGDIGVTLRVEDSGASWISGHLEWHRSDGTAGIGPELRQDVMDATGGAQPLAGFARGLIKATPEIAAALRPSARR